MNNSKNSSQHTVDALFVITLFCVFAVCASLLIALGANIYKKTIDTTDRHFTLNTAAAFVTEKIHQHDIAGSISISDLGEGNALVLREQYGEATYYDYIYYYKGYVRELLVAEGTEAAPESGTKLIETNDFKISIDSDRQLIHLSITDLDGDKVDNTIYIHSDMN